MGSSAISVSSSGEGPGNAKRCKKCLFVLKTSRASPAAESTVLVTKNPAMAWMN
jgi:hypothetical protein